MIDFLWLLWYFCVSADPDGRLVRPEELVFIDAVEATLLGGVPVAKNKKLKLKH